MRILEWLNNRLERILAVIADRFGPSEPIAPVARKSESAPAERRTRTDGRPSGCRIAADAAVPGEVAESGTVEEMAARRLWSDPKCAAAAAKKAETTLKEAFRGSRAWSVRRSGNRLYLAKTVPYVKNRGSGGDEIKSFRVIPCCALSGVPAAPLVAPPGYDDLCMRAAKAIEKALLKFDERPDCMRTFPLVGRGGGRIWVEMSPAVSYGGGAFDAKFVADHGARMCLDVSDVIS